MRRRSRSFTLPADFEPVPVRPRLDGWTPERQIAFLQLLAETGCVQNAANQVGMSAESAYRLVRRPNAQSFRLAWKMASDAAVGRLSDAVLSRAINGVEVPHFFAGELIGTHRKYDERLAMFILRSRMPQLYGREPTGENAPAERIALMFGQAMRLALRDAVRELNELPRQTLRLDEIESGAPAEMVQERLAAEE
jgi:hypothetical protein